MKTRKLTLVMLMFMSMVFITACDDDVTDDDMPEEVTTEETTLNDGAVRAKIESLERDFETAANNRDADGVAAYYAEDAESYAPNSEARRGKSAIRESIKKEIDADTTNSKLKLTVNDVWSSGNIAVEIGTWQNTSESGIVTNSGRYMTLFEKRDGKYVAIRDIFNSDQPRKDLQQ